MKTSFLAISLTSLLAVATLTHANERRFAFTYEAATAPKGSFEYEQHFIWKHGSNSDSYKFRQEFEYGVTDRLQLGVYLFDFQHSVDGDARDTNWAGSGFEAIYQLSDPNKDVLGSALYSEVLLSDKTLQIEGKLILQKNFGPLMVAWNGIIEAEWEDGYSSKVGVLEQTLGISYQIQPSLSVGLEAKHEVEFENWSRSGGNSVYVGPNVSIRKGSFFATMTCLFRVTDVPGEPKTTLGTIIGFHF